MVRCPACKTVFSAADTAPEPEPEPEREETRHLTCPNCRSGLEVPAGTTAMVRCPACRTVFSPADSAVPEPEEDERPKVKARKPARADRDGDEDRPRK